MSEPEDHLDLEGTFQTLRAFIGRVFAIALRSLQHWPAMVIAAMAGVAAAYVAPKFVLPVYETQAVLAYRETVRTQDLIGGGRPIESWNQKSTALRDMLNSRSYITKLLGELGLYEKVVKSEGMIVAVERFRSDLSVGVRDGGTLVLRFRAADPKQTVRVVERLIEDLKSQPNVAAAEQAAETKRFLEKQLDEVDSELSLKEAELATFLSQHPEFAEAAAGKNPLAAITRAQDRAAGSAGATRSARLATLQRQRQALQQQLGQPVQVAPAPKPQLSPEDSRRIAAAEAEVSKAQAELRRREQRFTQKHPDVIAAQKELSIAQAKLKQARAGAALVTPEVPPPPVYGSSRQDLEEQLAEVEKAIEAESRALAARTARPERKQAPESDAELSPSSTPETQWGALNRDVQAIRGRHEEIQRRLFAAETLASIQTSGAAGQIVVVDPPLEPQLPATRGPRRTAALAFVGVLSIGFLVALLLALLDDRLYDGYDLRRLKIGPIAHVAPPYSPTGKAVNG